MKRFKNKDRIPVTLAVLNMIGMNYLIFTVKALIESKYPDLKGLVCTDMVDDGNTKLLEAEENEFGYVNSCSITSIITTIDALDSYYGFNSEKDIIEDRRLWEFAKNIYWDLVIDDFPRDNELDEFGNPGAPGHLEYYAESMVPVIYTLLTLLVDGKIDPDLDWENDLSYLTFMYEDYKGHEYAFALGQLQELGLVLNRNHLILERIISQKRKIDGIADL